MSKRVFHRDLFQAKKFKSDTVNWESSDSNISKDIETTLQYLKSKFSTEKTSFPPVYFVHQLYSIIKDKTKVDRAIGELKSAGSVISYKLRSDKDDVALIVAFFNDIADHISQRTSSRVVSNFVHNILPFIKAVSVEKHVLKNMYTLTDKCINELVHENLLVIRDVGNYWLSFPGAGEFAKTYFLGRKSLLRIIAKSKYSEILESELVKRKLPKKALLSLEYYLHDVIGSDAVTCIDSTSGKLLRISS